MVFAALTSLTKWYVVGCRTYSLRFIIRTISYTRSQPKDPNDQVAIHEAMEQQTISITKAGIQATLNARASILAAANPIHGRYDRTKTLKANVALSAPILSRFDLFFVVLDECNPDSDRQVAQHILKVHRSMSVEHATRPPFTKEQMQRYIRFAKTINPKLTVEAQHVLVDCYRKLRQGDTMGRSSAYRITVRQLESMIRLSEALARLFCDEEIQPSYVREAFRLLKTSIIQVETSDVHVEDDEDDDERPTNMEEDDDDDDGDEPETQQQPQQQRAQHPGEYGGEPAADVTEEEPPEPKEKAEEKQEEGTKSKKKTKITFEEYEGIANAIATHLRSLEDDNAPYLKWSQVVEWYLHEVEQDLDSVEGLEEMRKKLKLVIRRLLHVDLILVTIGEAPKNKKQEGQTLLGVHPNYVV
jgi:DNA replication licensing factor MCM6